MVEKFQKQEGQSMYHETEQFLFNYAVTLLYVRPGTRFDLTRSRPFGRTKREKRIICIGVLFRRFFRQIVTLKRCLVNYLMKTR